LISMALLAGGAVYARLARGWAVSVREAVVEAARRAGGAAAAAATAAAAGKKSGGGAGGGGGRGGKKLMMYLIVYPCTLLIVHQCTKKVKTDL